MKQPLIFFLLPLRSRNSFLMGSQTPTMELCYDEIMCVLEEFPIFEPFDVCRRVGYIWELAVIDTMPRWAVNIMRQILCDGSGTLMYAN